MRFSGGQNRKICTHIYIYIVLQHMSGKCACATGTHFSMKINQPKIMSSTSNDQVFEDD